MSYIYLHSLLAFITKKSSALSTVRGSLTLPVLVDVDAHGVVAAMVGGVGATRVAGVGATRVGGVGATRVAGVGATRVGGVSATLVGAVASSVRRLHD